MSLPYLIIPIALANSLLGLFVFLKSDDKGLKSYFFFFTIAITVWLATNFYFEVIDQTLFILKSQYSFGSLVLLSAFPWTLIFVRGQLSRGVQFLIGLVGAALFAIPYIDGVLISNLVKAGNGSYDYAAGPLFSGYSSILLLATCLLVYELYTAYRRTTGLKKEQIKYILSGIGIFSLVSLVYAVVLPIFNIKPVTAFDAMSSVIWVALTAYAIVAHNLFDIKVIIKRTLVYSGLLLFAVVTYSMIIFLFATILGDETAFTAQRFVTNLVAAALIAIGYEPLRLFLIRVTDKYLFVGEYNSQEVIAELAQNLSSVLDLDEALKSTMKVLTQALRVETAATFVLRSDKDQGMIVHSVQSVGYKTPGQLRIGAQSPLIQLLSNPREVLVTVQELSLKCERTTSGDHPRCRAILQELEGFDAAVAVPIRVADKLIGILVLGPKLSGDVFTTEDLKFLDIAAKQTAAAIEKSRFYEDDQLKSEFVSIASHELLTPTAAIEGYLSMILDEKMAQVDPKAEEYLRKVQSSAHRLAELVKDLLSVSRIESGKIVINKQPIEVSPLIRQTMDEIKVRADQQGISMEYIAPQVEPPKVLADPERFIQIVTNLISNAIKYNKPNGSITIRVGNDDKFVTVSVQDTGIGIPAAHIPHLFEKFYRVHDDSAAAEKVGTGLGLFITRSIIELQGGKIWVTSEAGKGCDFRFTLPIA